MMKRKENGEFEADICAASVLATAWGIFTEN